VSGNPKGPGTGSRNRASLLLDRMAEGEAEAVLASVLAAAKAGDMGAAKLLLDRVWPQRRGRPVHLELPRMETPADLAAALGAVAGAVGRGNLSPEEGSAVAAVLEAQRRAIETQELEQRLAALEASVQARPGARR
jgi:hypothetical protein